jgi:WD40 repeat protein
MHFHHRLSLLTVILLPASLLATGDTPAVRTDHHGDPLPAGAVARLGTVRLRHGDDITALTFSRDGKILASGSWDGQLSLWATESGKELCRIQGESTRGISLLRFSPDGKHLAFSEHYLRSVLLCDSASGKVSRKLETGEVDALAFTPDGRLLTWSGEHATGSLWDITTGKVVDRLDGLGKVNRLIDFMPSGKGLVLSTTVKKSHTIRIWDLAARREKHRFQVPWELGRCILSPDGVFLVFMDREGDFSVRTVTDGKEIRRFGPKTGSLPCPWVSILVSPDGKTLAEIGPITTADGFEGMVRLWDIATGKEVRQLRGPWGGGLAAGRAAFSPDGKFLAVSGSDHAIHLFDVATGKEHLREGEPLGSVGQVAFSSDGKLLATSSLEFVRLWDATGKELSRLPIPRTGFDSVLTFTENSKRLVWGSTSSGIVLVWDVSNGKKLCQSEGPEGNWWAVGLSADAEVMALGGAYEPWLVGLEVTTGKTRWQLDYRNHAVSCLALSPQGESLAVVIEEGMILLTDLKAGKLRHKIRGNEPASNGPSRSLLAFSPDGRTLASLRPKDGVQFWEVATGQERARLKHLPVQVRSIAFAPNNRLFACGTSDGAVEIWDLATDERMFHGRGHRGSVGHLAFSANSKLLLSGSTDTTALVWDLRPGAK